MKTKENLNDLRRTAREIRGAALPKSITPEMVGGSIEGVVDVLGETLDYIHEHEEAWKPSGKCAQETGDRTDIPMSQKAVSDNLRLLSGYYTRVNDIKYVGTGQTYDHMELYKARIAKDTVIGIRIGKYSFPEDRYPIIRISCLGQDGEILRNQISEIKAPGEMTYIVPVEAAYVNFSIYFAPAQFSYESVKGFEYMISEIAICDTGSLPVRASKFKEFRESCIAAKDAITGRMDDYSSSMEACRRLLYPSHIVQPQTHLDNLFAYSERLLSEIPQGTPIGVCPNFEYYDMSDGDTWGNTLLVEVKPGTAYFASRWNRLYEFDALFRLVKVTTVNGGGYQSQPFTTSDTTRYISFNTYIDVQGGKINSTIDYIVEGDMPDVPLARINLTDIPVDSDQYGIPRKFIPYDDGQDEPSTEEPALQPVSKTNQWAGKTLLAIGDSITAANKWQQRVGELLGMNVRTHAKGGIGITAMVDGDGSGEAPEGYDPDDFGVSALYALNIADVKNVDIVILMGFYNERSSAVNNPGAETDMYPAQHTVIGRINYAVKRVYEELEKANNMQCKVVICTAHRYGKYSYIDKTAYDDGEAICEVAQVAANYNSIPCIDLMHNGNINRYNWNEFQSSPTPYNSSYIPADGINDGTDKPFESVDAAPDPSANDGKYITISDGSIYRSDGSQWVLSSSGKCPWNSDQLHLNARGYARIGDYIAGCLLSLF